MKSSWKRELFGLTVLAVMAVVAIHYYPLLPDPMPSHFNLQGKIDGWMGKTSFFLMMAGVLVLPYLLITFLPFIDPLRKKIEPRFKVLLFLRDVLLVFFSAIFFLNFRAAFEGRLPADLSGIAIGLLLIIVSNYMPKLPQNWFIGIRTPWTLSSEIIWRKSHILGGWLFTLSGIIYVVCTLLKTSTVIPISSIIFAAVLSGFIYPFYLYKRNEKPDSVEHHDS